MFFNMSSFLDKGRSLPDIYIQLQSYIIKSLNLIFLHFTKMYLTIFVILPRASSKRTSLIERHIHITHNILSGRNYITSESKHYQTTR